MHVYRTPLIACICYLEIPAPNIEKAVAFYRLVFNWKIEASDLSSQKYSMFECGNGELSGGFDSTKTVSDGGVLIYLKVEDIDATLAIIDKAGGLVIRKKFEIGGGYGFSAIFKDPNGNNIGLWAKE